MKKIIFILLSALLFVPNAAMSVGRNHPNRFKGRVSFGGAKKPYAYCDRGWNVRIVGPITVPRSRVLLDTRLIHDSWRKGCRDERTKARGGFGGGRP